MKSDAGISSFEHALDCLTMIWAPAAEAWKLHQDWNLHSLQDIRAAAERAGYEICYVDLPMRVSGYAQVMAGKRYIVVNRATSSPHQLYTVAHELGHHVLHLNPSRDSQQIPPSDKGLVEVEVDLFAAMLVILQTKDKQREDVLRENPEALLFLAVSTFGTVVVIVIAALAYLWSRLFPARLPG